MADKEAKARIKINHMLEESGWRLVEDENGPANVCLELQTRISQKQLNDLGEDFEATKNGYLDFLLLDEKGHPLVVLEAKRESLNPLTSKEQARRYARAVNCRFIILSNGNIHYFWDLAHGNPSLITRFPEPGSVEGYKAYQPNPEQLVDEKVDSDYIVKTQKLHYTDEAGWKNENERPQFIEENKLRFLRDYQLKAVHALQAAVADGKSRFLFEMATGTGKTLTAAAVIKLFLRTRNAHRVLFLVDRLELEDQAQKAFVQLLKLDFKTVIYKENREDWRNAEIVVSTVQSLLFNNKYRRLFSPTDFDLIISDEAHRSIGGNARAVFEYFVGYKLGLTATPKDYLKKLDAGQRDPREMERRMLLDTYKTFGCEGSQPTFRYSLIDGVRDGFLVNPIVVDARTEVTTQLLSDRGYAVVTTNEDGTILEEIFQHKDFEKTFFSEATNRVFCQTFLKNALHDPISGEIGKTIIFAVSQDHAARLTQILNEEADKMFPGKYHSDFAMQVTSNVMDAQQMTINFTNNNLSGSENFVRGYKTSKTRVCCTVGMMTTGYDCTDLLNLCLMRPIFSPTDFIQIKGRGTRKHRFDLDLREPALKVRFGEIEKQRYKLFDFFANCEYFEEKFNYDEILKLPANATARETIEGTQLAVAETRGSYENVGPDALKSQQETPIGANGMKIDRMFFEKFEDMVKNDPEVRQAVEAEMWDRVLAYVNEHLMNKPEEYFTLEKLRQAAGVDRRITLREIIEKAYGFIPRFKDKDEVLEEEFAKFLAEQPPSQVTAVQPMKYYFKAYATDARVREIIDKKRFVELNTNPTFTMQDYKAVPEEYRKRIIEYIKDYVPLNQFAV
jgi:Type I site-specific restriction-modification system, R (restriction) subunit and related helicases